MITLNSYIKKAFIGLTVALVYTHVLHAAVPKTTHLCGNWELIEYEDFTTNTFHLFLDQINEEDPVYEYIIYRDTKFRRSVSGKWYDIYNDSYIYKINDLLLKRLVLPKEIYAICGREWSKNKWFKFCNEIWNLSVVSKNGKNKTSIPLEGVAKMTFQAQKDSIKLKYCPKEFKKELKNVDDFEKDSKITWY